MAPYDRVQRAVCARYFVVPITQLASAAPGALPGVATLLRGGRRYSIVEAEARSGNSSGFLLVTDSDSPFARDGLAVRVAPFAITAVLAEASIALPPGPMSAWPVAVSAVLLAATAASFLLPWSRLPSWLTVLVPLTYTGSVLALLLAAGATSGVGVVLLVPLIWTALFHRPWESGCVVAAIVATETIISLTPDPAPTAVLARRLLLWALLGALISVATHGLRDRIRRSQQASLGLQGQLREITVLEDRDRIAAALKDQVIQRIFAAGLTLQGALARSTEPDVRRRIAPAVDELDYAVRMLRDSIFGLDHQLEGRGMRQELLKLCQDTVPAPECSFTGPVDGALPPDRQVLLIGLLRDALDLVRQTAPPTRIEAVADPDTYRTVIETARWPTEDPEGSAAELAGLRDRAADSGASLDIEENATGLRLTWHLTLQAQAPASSAQASRAEP